MRKIFWLVFGVIGMACGAEAREREWQSDTFKSFYFGSEIGVIDAADTELELAAFAGWRFAVAKRFLLGIEGGISVQSLTDDEFSDDLEITFEDTEYGRLTARAAYAATDGTLIFAGAGYQFDLESDTSLRPANRFRPGVEGPLFEAGVEQKLSDWISVRAISRYAYVPQKRRTALTSDDFFGLSLGLAINF